jgi:hypothetical protein
MVQLIQAAGQEAEEETCFMGGVVETLLGYSSSMTVVVETPLGYV